MHATNEKKSEWNNKRIEYNIENKSQDDHWVQNKLLYRENEQKISTCKENKICLSSEGQEVANTQISNVPNVSLSTYEIHWE